MYMYVIYDIYAYLLLMGIWTAFSMMTVMNDTAMNIGMQILGTPPSISRLQKK